jgi:hypothetical protein
VDEFSSFAEPGIVYVPSVPNFDETDHTLPQPGEDDDLTIEVISAGLAVQVDEVGTDVTYVGKAQPGSLLSASVWQIQRLTEVGDDLVVEWASGTAEFNKVWDDHLILSYS